MMPGYVNLTRSPIKKRHTTLLPKVTFDIIYKIKYRNTDHITKLHICM